MDPMIIISVWENKEVHPPWQLIHMENGLRCFEVRVLVGLEYCNGEVCRDVLLHFCVCHPLYVYQDFFSSSFTGWMRITVTGWNRWQRKYKVRFEALYQYNATNFEDVYLLATTAAASIRTNTVKPSALCCGTLNLIRFLAPQGSLLLQGTAGSFCGGLTSKNACKITANG